MGAAFNQKKFSISNIQRYVDFMVFIPTVDPTKVKYLDECHFVSSELFRTRAIGPIGERVMTVSNEALDGNLRLTMTLCTSLAGLTSDDMAPVGERHHPVWANVTYGGNTAVNFAHTIFEMVSAGYLCEGDVIILDNAKVRYSIYACSTQLETTLTIFNIFQIHTHAEVLPIIREVLDALGVTMYFQPCYSPEFNACERVFGYLKNKLRARRLDGVPLLEQLCVLLACITVDMMKNWYRGAFMGTLP